MKKMKTSLAIAVALATGVGTSAFAQVKQDIITFNLTVSQQQSVSQSATIQNSGDWFQIDPVSGLYGGPKYYKTAPVAKITQKNILQYIAYVLHGNANYYTPKANLVLVEGELSGFFNITAPLAASTADTSANVPIPPKALNAGKLTGDTGLPGTITSTSGDADTQIAYSTGSTFETLANGRHFLKNPDADDATGAPNPVPTADTTDFVPVGHMQPWGQIYVQDAGHTDPVTLAAPLCENVTYFFALSVAECYDCFYMNSFISQATFKTVVNTRVGPPCCNAGSTVQGAGKDSYYLTLSFDNTQNNPYLYPLATSGIFVGVTGIAYNAATKTGIPGDAIAPDEIKYQSPIESGISKDYLYEARFTLNGILTYTWKLGFINKTDVAPDFLGTANYTANGYGFLALYCSLLSGTATFSEAAVKTACCLGTENALGLWNGSWYAPGAEYVSAATTAYDAGILVTPELTPFNTAVSLTYHYNFDFIYPSAAASADAFPSGWPNPSVVVAPFAAGANYLDGSVAILPAAAPSGL